MAQKDSIQRSDKWYKREAFKNIDHFYMGGHIGMGLPIFYSINRDITTGVSTTEAPLRYDTYFMAPPHRLYMGYKWKRHYFDLSLEGKSFFYMYDTQFMSQNPYPAPSLGYYISFGYCFDFLPRLNDLKLSAGINAGAYFSVKKGTSTPAAGFNMLVEVPVTRIFSLYVDFRYTVGFLPLFTTYIYPYNTSYESRLMAFDFNLGFRFNIFAKEKGEQGWSNYNNIKPH